MKKILLLITLTMFAFGIHLAVPKTAPTAPPPTDTQTEIRTAAADERKIVITTNCPSANEQIHVNYGAGTQIGVTGTAGIFVPDTAQIILELFTPAGKSYYTFEQVTINGGAPIRTLPYDVPIDTTDLNIDFEFTAINFEVITEICDNEGNTFPANSALYQRIRSHIAYPTDPTDLTQPTIVTMGSAFAIVIDESALYANEMYTLSGIQIRSFDDLSGNVITPYSKYNGAGVVDSEFIDKYSKNTRNILVRVNLIKKYRLSIITPTDPNAEWLLTVLDNGKNPTRDPSKTDGYNYLVDSGSKITLSTEVINKFTANDGFAGIPDVNTLTTDTPLIKATEFFIKNDSSIRLLIAPRVFELAGVTNNPNYQLTKTTIALGDRVGITLLGVPANYHVTKWTINGRNYTVEGNTIYLTADKLWFQTNDNFIDMDEGIIQIDSNPVMSFNNDIFMVVGLPAGIILLAVIIMFIIVAISRKRSETVKEYLLGTGKTYRTKLKAEKKQATAARHKKELDDFENAKKERAEKRNASRNAAEAKRKEEEAEMLRQNKMTVEQKQALYEEQASEYKMPSVAGADGAEAAAAAPKPKAASVQDIMNAKYNMPPAPAAEPTPAGTETPTPTETPAPEAVPATTAEPTPMETPAPTAESAVTTPTTEQPAITTEQPAPVSAPAAPITPTPAAPAPVPTPTPMPAPIPAPLPPRPASTMPMPPRPNAPMGAPRPNNIPPRVPFGQPPAAMPPRPMPAGITNAPRPPMPQAPAGPRPQPQPLTGQHMVTGQPIPPRMPLPPNVPPAPPRP